MGQHHTRRTIRRLFAVTAALALLAGIGSSASAAPPEGNVVQPDAIVLGATGTVSVGRNVYNQTGEDQTMRGSGPHGTRFGFRFRMQNDSDAVQFLTPTGCASNANFTVKYFLVDNDPQAPDIEVTSSLTSGALSVGRNPGQTETYRVSIRIKPGAAAGAKLTCLLSVRINVKGPDDPTDVARIIIKRTATPGK